MSEKKRILEALRMRMRRDGMTYAQLAQKLSVSEVSVKRYFSEERLTLDMLDEVCAALGATLEELFADLRQLSEVQRQTFTEEQEFALAKDEFLFVLFFVVSRGFSFDELIEKFSSLKPAKLIKGLRELESLGLVSYPSNGQLRSLVSCNAQIRPGGPLWKRYSAVGIERYFDSKFSAANEYFSLSLGYLSERSIKILKGKFETLENEIKMLLTLEQLSEKSRERRRFYWLATSFRPMESSVLETIAERSKLFEH